MKLILWNVKIDMFKGFMWLVVDKWGRVELVFDVEDFVVKEDNNFLFVEYEFVNVIDE